MQDGVEKKDLLAWCGPGGQCSDAPTTRAMKPSSDRWRLAPSARRRT